MPEPVTGHEWTAIVLAISAQIEASSDSDEIAELNALRAKCADWRDCAQNRPQEIDQRGLRSWRH